MKQKIKIMMLLTLTALTAPCLAETVTFVKVGDMLVGSDGTVIQQVGDIVVMTKQGDK